MEAKTGGRRIEPEGAPPQMGADGEDSSRKIRRIQPAQGWGGEQLFAWARELWEYRDLLWSLAMRDLRLRYRQTALGVLWVVFQPLAGAGIFAVVFGWVAGFSKGKEHYFLYSMAGLLAWNCFQSTFLKASMSVVANGALVAKVYFPRMLLPLSTVLSTMVDLCIGLGAFSVVAWSEGCPPSFGLLWLPCWVGLGLLFALGMGMMAAALMTRFRDVQHVLPMLLPFFLYATPVAYGLESVPERWRMILGLNPVSWMVQGVRSGLCRLEGVPWNGMVYSTGVALAAFLVGGLCFRRMERSLADVL
ncbi:MAG: hypothetical protein RLZZ142_282 [Verrucomicrobiota bacterium]